MRELAAGQGATAGPERFQKMIHEIAGAGLEVLGSIPRNIKELVFAMIGISEPQINPDAERMR